MISTGTGSGSVPWKTVQAVAFMPGLTSFSGRISTFPAFGRVFTAGRGASAADTKEVQMLHWWTSGGEAAALNVIKQALAKQGYDWKDVPVAGGGGGAAMTTLKAMVAAGNPPTASQILGYYALDYADAGKLADITPLATKGG